MLPILTLIGAQPLLLVFWSDEWNQYDYRGVKLRILKMRILNDPVIETHTVGVYPEGRYSLLICSNVCRYRSAGNLQAGGAS